MLRLRLSRGSDVFIGDNTRIIVLDICKGTDQVELGFQAPRELKILRGHLYRNKRHKDSDSHQSSSHQPSDEDSTQAQPQVQEDQST